MLAVIAAIVGVIVRLESTPLIAGEMDTTFWIGFALIGAYLAGALTASFRLPRITGYLAAGMVFGPFLIGFLDAGVLDRLAVFNKMALAFIGLAAGAELRLAVLREKARSVILLIVVTTATVVVGVTGILMLTHGVIPALGGRSFVQLMAMCALVGVVAAARSPSSAIAIINETRARGPFTETILGVAMSMDLLILPLFSVAASLAALAFAPERSFNVLFILVLCGEIGISIALGVALGVLLATYLKYNGPQQGLVILGLCFLVYKSSDLLAEYLQTVHAVDIHLEPLLITAAVGFTVQNASRQGEAILEILDKVGLPVYVVFFTMAGAALNLGAVVAGWAAAVILVGARLLMIILGARLATTLAGDPPAFRAHTWMGFVTQAGLSIALASQLAASFDAWGRALGSLLIAAIAVNQIIGPVAFKFALDRVGESRKTRSRPERADAAQETAS